MRIRCLPRWLLAGAAVVAPAMAWAEPPAPSAEGLAVAAKFGALDEVQQISLSPDGKKIAVVTPLHGGGSLIIIDADAGTMKGIMSRPEDQRLLNCSWSTNTRLICRVWMKFDYAGSPINYTRQFALNADGSGIVALTAQDNGDKLSIVQNGGEVIDNAPSGKKGVVLMTRQIPVLASTTSAANRNSTPGLAVEEVDTLNLKREIIEPANDEAENYISDGYGHVRIMQIQPTSSASGYAQNNYRTLFHPLGSHAWKPLTTINVTNSAYNSGFDPDLVDGKANLAYGTDMHDGFRAVYSMALDGTNRETLVAAEPGLDARGLVTIGPHNRVVGVSFDGGKRKVEFFDPEIKALNAALSKALPGNPEVAVSDTSDDESSMLVYAYTDTDPGGFYLFVRGTHQLAQVLPLRPELAGMVQGAKHFISFPATDGTKVPAYLTLPPGSSGKNLPAIVMPHGGPEARDEWGFDFLAEFFAARGYAVIQPEFRGSTGFGLAWYNNNAFKNWATAINDVNDAGRWLISQGIAAPGKLAIFGWSYGGYAALQANVVDPDLYKAAVAVAPITDFDRWREELRNHLNFNTEDARIGNGPHIEAGSPARHADRFKAPVLLFHGDKDQNVGIGESLLMRDRLRSAGKSVDMIEFPGLDHQLYTPEARTRMLSTSDAFIRKALGMAP